MFAVSTYIPQGSKLVTKGVRHTGKGACVSQQGGERRRCITPGQDRQMGDTEKMLTDSLKEWMREGKSEHGRDGVRKTDRQERKLRKLWEIMLEVVVDARNFSSLKALDRRIAVHDMAQWIRVLVVHPRTRA